MKRWYGTILSYFWLTVGAFVGAISVIIFLAPLKIAPGGLSGIAVILNYLFHTPIGLMVLVLNVPVQIFGYFMLPHGWRVLVRTIYVLIAYTFAIDFLVPVLPTGGVSDNVLLSAIFGGVIGGIGGGLVLRAGGTFGGTSTLALIIQQRTGMPLSSIYLYTDTAIIAAAGLVFGWEAALYAIVSMFIGGLATDYVLEGPSIIRTATIITDQPDAIRDVVLNRLQRGLTGWEAQGMYTGETHHVLFVTVSRAQVPELRRLVSEADPNAFLVIGQGHAAYGVGFRRRQSVMD